MSSLPPKPILYLAGPMTGWPDFNYPAFAAAQAYLEAQGWQVRSPHTIGQHDGWTHADYMEAAWALFIECQAIVLLPGWPYSTGARMELGWAIDRGIPVYFLADDARGLTLMAAGRPTPALEAVG